MFAVKVTAQSTQGEDLGARVEVEEGFLFDRVNCHRGYLGVIQIVESAVQILVHPESAEFPQANPTAPLAGVALHPQAG